MPFYVWLCPLEAILVGGHASDELSYSMLLIFAKPELNFRVAAIAMRLKL